MSAANVPFAGVDPQVWSRVHGNLTNYLLDPTKTDKLDADLLPALTTPLGSEQAAQWMLTMVRSEVTDALQVSVTPLELSTVLPETAVEPVEQPTEIVATEGVSDEQRLAQLDPSSEEYAQLADKINGTQATPITVTAPAVTPAPDILSWGLWAVSQGCYVFPLRPKEKVTATPNGFMDSTNDPEVVRKLWTAGTVTTIADKDTGALTAVPGNPFYNYGIDLGKSNLVVYDYDIVPPFANMPATLRVKTGRVSKPGENGGFQDYYRGLCKTHSLFIPPVEPVVEVDEVDKKGRPIKVRRDALGRIVGKQGVAVGEVRSRGAYVVGPGSLHPSGNYYSILIDAPIADSPEQTIEPTREAGPALGTDAQVALADRVEAAFDKSDIDYKTRTAYQGGFMWLIDCPWESEHSGGKGIKDGGSSTAVFVASDGKLGFACKHAHCEGRTWKEFRQWMEQQAGPLQFTDGVFLKMAGTGGLTSNYVEPKAADNVHAVQAAFTTLTTYFPTVDMSALKALLATADKPDPSKVVLVRDVSYNRESANNPFSLPETVLTGRLADIYHDQFKPNDLPLELAFPALVTAASARVPALVIPEMLEPSGTQIQHADTMVNLYTALITDVNAGKSQVIEWACRALNIFNPEKGPRYLEGKFGSPEMMLKYLKKNLPDLKQNFLINPDEWAFMFQKAGIPNSSFSTFMTTSFYRRRQTFEVGNHVGLVQLNHALSFISGIVEDDFDGVFNASSLGGLYDRFLFGYAPGWKWDYRPYPFKTVLGDTGWDCVNVVQDPSVFGVIKEWNKDRRVGRIVEICVRAATIMASLDGRRVLYAKDVEALLPVLTNQLTIRTKFPPNPGLNPDATFSNAVINWLQAHTQGEWATLSTVKRGIHGYEMKLGPKVAEVALGALSRGDRIDLWLPRDRNGNEAPLPADWTKRRPSSGLIRLRQGID